MTTALKFNGVAKYFRRSVALDGFDLAVPAGSICGFVGSNGAGKTTAMAVAVGLLQPSAGTVDLLGAGSFDTDRHLGRVALLPQDSRFPPHARVEELLAFYCRLQRIGGQAVARIVDEAIAMAHLGDRRRSPIRTLSHGMVRRLAIAQAFLGNPELVLLDEPMNGLDPREAVRIRDLILRRRGRQTIVISSHNLADIETLCDNVAFIERGRCVRQGALDAIIHRASQVRYVFEKAIELPAPGDLPGLRAELEAGGTILAVAYGDDRSLPDVNAQVLSYLLARGARILETRRGSELEHEYLQSSGAK